MKNYSTPQNSGLTAVEYPFYDANGVLDGCKAQC